jgi:pimeloyl-ACP methyl ester carboxylesterase
VPRSRPLLVILPGNPGEAAFYRQLVALLRARGHETIVASHPCLPAPPSDLLVYALHHAEATLGHLQGTGRRPEDVDLVLIGHSVGAYLAHLIVAHRLLPVARVIMMCPTLMRPALSGRLILRALSWHRTARLALALLRLLPGRLQRWLARSAGAADLAPTILALLRERQVLGWVHMAAAEHREFAPRRSAAYLFERPLFRDPARFTVLYVRRDRWCPPALIRQLLPYARALPPPATHSLVVDDDQRRIVADALEALLTGAPPAPGA